MSGNDFDDTEINILTKDKEEDYLRQVNSIEQQEQNYINPDVPMAEDISSIALKKQLNIQEGNKAKKSLMFELKDVNVFRLYFHLSGPFEIFLMIMGFIGSIATGASNPIMASLTGSTTSDASESAENRLEELTEEEKQIFFAKLKKNMDKKVKQFLIYGAASFVAAFMSNFFWEYAALRQMHHLKEKYFERILMQEQGWFDQNNAYEFATKVQVQLEQIELGVGEKFGTLIESGSTFITGLIISFFASWKITLVILCVAPFLAICMIYMVTSTRQILFLSRKAYETAGGVAEEVLYNIKTVVSFGNFDYERQRFGHYAKIKEQAANKYPSVEVTTYSPPYKAEFTQEENEAIVQAINSAHPDLLWIGMTAPKQEKWAWQHWSELDIDCHVGTIGAVFDFFAGTSRRAPRWWQEHSLEWLYRLCMEPGRMWRRYVLGNPLFLYHVMREKLTGNP